jgi:cystathionine gamma-synthase
MQEFVSIPLGTPIPDSPHAVSCSLPTMAAVRGYEEKDPEVTSRLQAGYPRFVVHPFTRRLNAELAKRHGLSGRTLWLTSSRRMAAALVAHLNGAGPGGAKSTLFAKEGAHGVSHPESPEIALRAKLYLQHIGGFISSRESEDILAAMGVGPQPGKEEMFPGNAAAEVVFNLKPLFKGTRTADLLLANSGMNAIHAAFCAINSLQSPKGRTAWVQLGWLYLDTISILKKFTASPADYIHVADVMDIPALEKLMAERGDTIAGVMAEVPTNPLIETPDVEALAALCRRHSVKLVLDPSVASAYSVDCLPHADLVVTSLTKYTGNEGDVIAGLVAVNPAGPDAAFLRQSVASVIETPYSRDLSRLAAQISHAGTVLGRIQESTPKVAAFLSSHPGVRVVHWVRSAPSRENFLRIARTPESTGGMISFALRGKLERFYDRLRLPKGPSFGMRTTLICPFMYLAHYDMVNTPEGRARLEANGLDPELLRLCVGTEPADEIIAALAEALAAETAP